MPFDPNLPANGSPLVSAEMRGQLTGLKDLIDAVPNITGAQVDSVVTLDPNEPATVSVNLVGTTLHLTFGIPKGFDGSEGPEGAPGEVAQQDLDDAINGTANNCDQVGNLGMTVGDPPGQSEMQMIADKMDELINALRRN